VKAPALAALVLVGLVAAPAAARADAPCDPATAASRAAAIRAHLEREARHARWWDLGWGVGLGVVGAGQVGLAAVEYFPFRDWNRDVAASLYVGATQSAIGSLAHVVLPLDVVRAPDATGDGCADLAAAQRALVETADHEKEAFWLNHVGNVAVSTGGLLVLGLAFDTWEEGVSGFVLSYIVGLATTYTQPRASWKAVRRGTFEAPPPAAVSWRLGVVRRPDFSGLVVVGSF